MNYFYDTEFIEDGQTIELISIGIVAEDGREYYAINKQVRLHRAPKWVKENVILPHLPLASYCNDYGCKSHIDLRAEPEVKHPRTIAAEVFDFLTAAGIPVLWADFAAYDHVALCQLWGPMISLPKPLPYFTHELEQLWEDRGRPLKPAQKDPEHHALHDARYDRDLYQRCMEPR